MDGIFAATADAVTTDTPLFRTPGTGDPGPGPQYTYKGASPPAGGGECPRKTCAPSTRRGTSFGARERGHRLPLQLEGTEDRGGGQERLHQNQPGARPRPGLRTHHRRVRPGRSGGPLPGRARPGRSIPFTAPSAPPGEISPKPPKQGRVEADFRAFRNRPAPGCGAIRC